MYKLGVVGIGHWFGRLHAGMKTVGGLEVATALGTRPFEAKKDILGKFGITKGMYYTLSPDGSIPDGFFNGIDAVHISDPNSEHARQTIEALDKGKKAITEKSFAVNKGEFDDFRKYVVGNKQERNIYLHLHYMHKLPALELKRSIDSLAGKYGKVTEVKGTFFEAANEEDSHRGWLFDLRNGGLFMDWIHPFEVIYASTPMRFGKLQELGLYSVNSAYSKDNPTGVYASVGLSGKNFADGAMCSVRMAKGTDQRWARKSMRFTFESGNYALLNFDGSEKEFESGSRGALEIGAANGHEFVKESDLPLNGENSSEKFVREILELCSGRNPGLSISDVDEIFKPQWEYQSMAETTELVKDVRAVRRFLEGGIRA